MSLSVFVAERDQYNFLLGRMVEIDPWKTLKIEYERILERFQSDADRIVLFSTNFDSKFDFEKDRQAISGLVAFKYKGVPELLERICPDLLASFLEKNKLAAGDVFDGEEDIGDKRRALFSYVNALAVFPEYQKKGIGKYLLEKAESMSYAHFASVGQKNGELWNFLFVSSFNLNAQEFYTKKMGYERIGQVRDMILSGYDEILLVKKIVDRA